MVNVDVISFAQAVFDLVVKPFICRPMISIPRGLTISGRTPQDDGRGGSEKAGELATASFPTTGTEIPSVLEAPLQFSTLEYTITSIAITTISSHFTFTFLIIPTMGWCLAD